MVGDAMVKLRLAPHWHYLVEVGLDRLMLEVAVSGPVCRGATERARHVRLAVNDRSRRDSLHWCEFETLGHVI